MEGQQAFVTGDDGDQMVFSGREIAGRLVQEEVMIDGGEVGKIIMGEGGEGDPEKMDALEKSILERDKNLLGEDESIPVGVGEGESARDIAVEERPPVDALITSE